MSLRFSKFVAVNLCRRMIPIRGYESLFEFVSTFDQLTQSEKGLESDKSLWETTVHYPFSLLTFLW